MTRWIPALMICTLAPCRGAEWDDPVGSQCADLNRAVLNQAAKGKLTEAQGDLKTTMANRKGSRKLSR